MSTLGTVLLIILAVLIVLLIGLYFFGRKMQKKQAIQQEQMEAAKQNVTMLIIDKKKMKLKDAGLPAAVYEQTPKLLRRQKVPVVKAKVGPKIQTFMCDAAVFDEIPLKKEVRVTASGLYITGVKGLRKPLDRSAVPKKKSLSQRLREKAKNLQADQAAGSAPSGKKKKQK